MADVSNQNTKPEGTFRKLVRSMSRSNNVHKAGKNSPPIDLPNGTVERPMRTTSRPNQNGGGHTPDKLSGLSTSPAPDSYFPQPPAATFHDSEASGRGRHPDSKGARANDIGEDTQGQAAPGVSFAPSMPGVNRIRPDSELLGWKPPPRRTQSQRTPRGTSNGTGSNDQGLSRHRAGSAGQANGTMPPPPAFSDSVPLTKLPSGNREGVSLEDKPMARSTSVKRAASAMRKAVFAPPEKGQGEKRVLIMVADGTEEIEIMTAYDIFVRASLGPTIVSISPLFSPSQSLPYITLSRGARMLADTQFETLKQEHKDDFDAIVIPGGAKGAERISSSREVQTLIRSFHAQGKLVAAICAGSLAIKHAGIAGGQKLTSHPSVKGELEKHYDYSEERVVVSDNLVTSRGPGTAMEWALTIVGILAGDAKRREVEGPLMM